jgi:outer membrane receptor protein involved in Fe transport
VQIAFGGEYREEKTTSRFSDLELGLLPAGSPAGPAGTFIGDISGNQQLVFDGQTRTFNAGGTFDVNEFFAEVSAPLARGMFLAEEITVGAAARYADYSTIGGATTWNVNAVWAPVADLRLRATLSEAIRAPNISELFDPQQGATFRPSDPCDQTTLNATPNRRANCIAAATALGIPNPATFIANYSDPLTARFSGTSGGNPDLAEETASTWTVGAVFLPRWVPGLSFSVDYYSIEIEDAIAAVTAQDIVNTCYDNATFPNQFCDLIRRNGPGSGPTAFGFNFLQQTQLNFGRIETSGVDMQLNYGFGFRDYRFGVNLAANWTEKLNRFFDPIDTSLVNPGLNETGAPEWSGVGSLNVTRGPATVTWQTQYIGKQAIASAIQIERIQTEFGPAGFASSYLVHNLSGNYQVNDNLTAYAGVNNVADKEPYIASSAYPVSGMGRFYFAGLRAKF